MGHYAKIVDNKVVQTIVAESDFFNTFVDSSPGTWLATSYNTRGGIYYDPATGQKSTDQSKAIRANFAGINYNYDPIADVFYAPQPYPSWTIAAPTWLWEAPTPMPNDGKSYKWDEETLSWVEQNV